MLVHEYVIQWCAHCKPARLRAVSEMELSKTMDARAAKVWLDPTGSHAIVAVTSANAAEGHYVHAKWQKSRSLGKLRGILLSCIAWDLVKGSDLATG